MASAAPVILLADGTRIVLDVLVREEPSRTVDVTAHPVERGADVADHARLRNPETTWEVAVAAARADDVRTRLLAAIEARQPVTLATTRETYADMVLTQLNYPRSKETGDSFRATIKAVRVRFVSTQTRRIKVQSQRVQRTKGSAFRGAVATSDGKAGTYERQRSILSRLGEGEVVTQTFNSLERAAGIRR